MLASQEPPYRSHISAHFVAPQRADSATSDATDIRPSPSASAANLREAETSGRDATSEPSHSNRTSLESPTTTLNHHLARTLPATAHPSSSSSKATLHHHYASHNNNNVSGRSSTSSNSGSEISPFSSHFPQHLPTIDDDDNAVGGVGQEGKAPPQHQQLTIAERLRLINTQHTSNVATHTLSSRLHSSPATFAMPPPQRRRPAASSLLSSGDNDDAPPTTTTTTTTAANLPAINTSNNGSGNMSGSASNVHLPSADLAAMLSDAFGAADAAPAASCFSSGLSVHTDVPARRSIDILLAPPSPSAAATAAAGGGAASSLGAPTTISTNTSSMTAARLGSINTTTNTNRIGSAHPHQSTASLKELLRTTHTVVPTSRHSLDTFASSPTVAFCNVSGNTGAGVGTRGLARGLGSMGVGVTIFAQPKRRSNLAAVPGPSKGARASTMVDQQQHSQRLHSVRPISTAQQEQYDQALRQRQVQQASGGGAQQQQQRPTTTTTLLQSAGSTDSASSSGISTSTIALLATTRGGEVVDFANMSTSAAIAAAKRNIITPTPGDASAYEDDFALPVTPRAALDADLHDTFGAHAWITTPLSPPPQQQQQHYQHTPSSSIFIKHGGGGGGGGGAGASGSYLTNNMAMHRNGGTGSGSVGSGTKYLTTANYGLTGSGGGQHGQRGSAASTSSQTSETSAAAMAASGHARLLEPTAVHGQHSVTLHDAQCTVPSYEFLRQRKIQLAKQEQQVGGKDCGGGGDGGDSYGPASASVGSCSVGFGYIAEAKRVLSEAMSKTSKTEAETCQTSYSGAIGPLLRHVHESAGNDDRARSALRTLSLLAFNLPNRSIALELQGRTALMEILRRADALDVREESIRVLRDLDPNCTAKDAAVVMCVDDIHALLKLLEDTSDAIVASHALHLLHAAFESPSGARSALEPLQMEEIARRVVKETTRHKHHLQDAAVYTLGAVLAAVLADDSLNSTSILDALTALLDDLHSCKTGEQCQVLLTVLSCLAGRPRLRTALGSTPAARAALVALARRAADTRLQARAMSLAKVVGGGGGGDGSAVGFAEDLTPEAAAHAVERSWYFGA